MTTPYQQQAPAGPGYTSPIPVTSAHLGHALASEWTKIKSVRSTMWTIGILLFLVISIGLLAALQTSDSDFSDTPYTVPALFGLLLGQICVITLGVLVVSSEYGTGMIRTTFTASPQRWRVLAAKFMVFFVLTFVVTAFAIAFVGIVTAAVHSGPEARATTGSEWARTVLGGSLYVTLLGMLGLAVGSMLRHSAGAITTMLGVVLVPAIMPAFLFIWESTRAVAERVMEYNAPNSLSAIFTLPMTGDEGNGMKQLTLLAVITVVAMAGSFALLEKRDV
ncbi:ABC transporter permease [Streptomyces sp. A3M-1-3]|uniref:ABC transporter permease n=1 Tax=Streptomyces sp. A3M-1-3 TaxID=2962044 RepID=UPI0020B764AB|nr:ABC transporter permease subunit [Streptomyces sp. A3M-1-3]MCP3816907.1 ABC transporter permease [Streptomyces sp. A3M-1-3]